MILPTLVAEITVTRKTIFTENFTQIIKKNREAYKREYKNRAEDGKCGISRVRRQIQNKKPHKE